MDGLSGAASVIAVIQIAQSVASGLKDYYEGVRDARADIRTLYNSIKGLEAILSAIQDLLNRGDAGLAESKQSLEPPLRQSELDLTKLRFDLQGSQEKFQKFGRAAQSLAWPFKKKDVEKTVDALERNKSALMLGLEVENLNLVSQQFDITIDLLSDIRAAREESNRSKINAWLTCPDPSKEHRLARSRHEETTGSWFVEGNEFNKWMNSRNSFLWLYGGAGAGKSILCSTAIENLQQRAKGQPGYAVVYWYFTFTDTEKQTLSNCILSLLGDACSNLRKTPQGLQEAYDQANFGRQQPGTKQSLELLKETLAGLSDVFICLDALDECPKSSGERKRLLDAIHEMWSWGLESLHILATSRREVDIDGFFDALSKDLITQDTGDFSAVAVQGPQVKRDIEKFIQHRVQDRVFNSWTMKLRNEVEAMLASQAEGMFRLVALQLDVLSKQRSVKDIRAAMKTLPKTLDEFYDRILLQIEEEDREQAHIALQWIAFAVRPITLGELAEAIIVNPNTEPALDEDDRVLHCKTLLDFLPAGLVSTVVAYSSSSPSEPSSDSWSISDTRNFSGDDEEEGSYLSRNDRSENLEDYSSEAIIRFAHFSVKEYLVSTRILDGSAPNFQVLEMGTHSLIAKTCFAYMLWIGSKEPNITRELLSNFPLLDYSARCWTSHMCALNDDIDDNQLLTLALSFLAIDGYAWRIWISTGLPREEWNSVTIEALLRALLTRPARIEKPRIGVHPLTWASMFSMTSVVKLLLPRASSIDNIQLSKYSESIYGYPLYAASKYGSLQTVQMLVNAGASVNYPNPDYTPALWGAVYAGSYEKVKFLLDQGADVNGIGPDGNALTAAVLGWSKSVLELLLQSGAEVDAKDKFFNTALIPAATIGFLDGVQVLLDAGASINYTSQFETPLRAALINQNDDIVKLLLQSGADPNIDRLPARELLRDVWGDLGRRECEMLKLLLDGGLKVEIEDWRAIYERSTEGIRQLETELPEHKWRSQQLENAKSFLKLFEALPQWQAVKEAVLSN